MTKLRKLTVDGDSLRRALSFVHAGLGDGDIGRLHPVRKEHPGEI